MAGGSPNNNRGRFTRKKAERKQRRSKAWAYHSVGFLTIRYWVLLLLIE